MRITVRRTKFWEECPFRVETKWNEYCHIAKVGGCPSNKESKTPLLPKNCPLLKGDVEVHLVDDRITKDQIKRKAWEKENNFVSSRRSLEKRFSGEEWRTINSCGTCESCRDTGSREPYYECERMRKGGIKHCEVQYHSQQFDCCKNYCRRKR